MYKKNSIDAIDYLKGRIDKIIRNIDRIGETGTPQDSVRLKANQILLNKLIPERKNIDVDSGKSPYEIIRETLRD